MTLRTRGCLTVPEGPGLGVTLDPDLLEYYRWTEEKQAYEQVMHSHLIAPRVRPATIER